MNPAFDDVVHGSHRLRVLAVLDVTDRVEFSALRDLLSVADSVLSKQLKVLQDAGYVELEKPRGSGRVRTWVRATPAGRRAYTGHVAALRQIVAEPLAPPSAPTDKPVDD